ncbi:glycosyltransferase [Aureimonas sp. AU40]|uniref:glycosyltransferase n=1 Tax=Aureimonas sp. AU40 TaxID=1637747 RepID=UPI0007826641|nr:glycosyltransferase [Aureimonas sp. AU40]
MTDGAPRFLRLGHDLALLVWRGEVARGTRPVLRDETGAPPAPLSALALAGGEGGTRFVWALPSLVAQNATLALDTGGTTIALERFDAAAAPIADASLFEGLAPAARTRLVAALLSDWPRLFRLARAPTYLAAIRALLRAPDGAAGEARALVGTEGDAVIECALPPRFGAVRAATLVSRAGLVSLVPDTLPGERGPRRLLLPRPALAPGEAECLLALRGEGGFVLRRWREPRRVPGLRAWWEQTEGRDPGLRQVLIAALSRRSPASRAACTEFQLRCPLTARAERGGGTLPAAEIQIALAGASGTLAAGWLRDPGGFLDDLEILSDSEAPVAFGARLHRFAGKVAEPGGRAAPATGFLAFLPEVRGPLLQPRFLLRLGSGARRALTPPVQPFDGAARRAAALRAVAPQALDDRLMREALGPALADLQAEACAGVGAPIVKPIGRPVDDPIATIIVPLYRVLDFLPFQIAAFASDPAIAGRCEIIYVLDSPDQADVAEHLLTGLNLVYGLPVTLAVMARNGGYALANNRAAALARAPVLALVNSDVVPVRPGWLEALAARLEDPAVVASGPKLLFEDDSIQHAGLYFAPDHRGRWLNHHYYKGMPRHYAPAGRERAVPGVTGACLVLRRRDFEAVGGFTQDYVIGDYEDSDLCLKLRRGGGEIRYVPSAELYHLERRSMNENADYTKGVAAFYNSWLHEGRWRADMEALMHGPFALAKAAAA